MRKGGRVTALARAATIKRNDCSMVVLVLVACVSQDTCGKRVRCSSTTWSRRASKADTFCTCAPADSTTMSGPVVGGGVRTHPEHARMSGRHGLQ